MAVIEVKKLLKTFKVKLKEKGLRGSLKSIIKPKYTTVKAVNNVSFKVEKGEIIAFIGPNGAGKSTTIKMLTGILYPDKGEVSVLGIDLNKDEIEFINSEKHASAYCDIFYTHKNISISDIKIQQEEVDAVYWMSREEIDNLIKTGEFRKGNIDQYNKVLKYLEKKQSI